MCGLVGFVSLEGLPADISQRLKRATRLLYHRGPDEEGFYQDHWCALGHRRLAIIDLQSGKQPLLDKEAGLALVFNGEIYNFQTLRQELKEKGFRFQTKSDTEVILKAYRAWGPECVQRLNGMFAFALWDAPQRQLFFARDRLGKKPFYFRFEGSLFSFASELKAILGEEKREISPEALDCYLNFGYVPSPLTILKGFQKLPPAHAGIFSKDGLRIFRYWELSFSPQANLSLEEALEEFFSLFPQAVAERLISEVPLGAFLSGGIDSPLVVAQMQALLSQPVLTNSIGFEGGENELPTARRFATYLGTDHREFVIKPEAAQVLPKLIWHLDEPLADSSIIPTFYVCQIARQNVTVALSGDGGDESFGGYTFRYLPHLWESRLRQKIPPLLRGSLFSLLGHIYPQAPWFPKPLRLKTIWQNLSVSDAKAFYRDLVWLPPEIREEIYTPLFWKKLGGFSPLEKIYPLYEKVKELDPFSRAQYVDLHFYLPEDVLVKVDRMSMAVALEVRAPLLDHRLIEFAASLPLSLKLKGRKGKVLLREALQRFFPRKIISSEKKGFAVPEAQWLRKECRFFVEEALQDADSLLWQYLSRPKLRKLWEKLLTNKINLGVFFWGIMIFYLWEKEFYR